MSELDDALAAFHEEQNKRNLTQAHLANVGLRLLGSWFAASIEVANQWNPSLSNYGVRLAPVRQLGKDGGVTNAIEVALERAGFSEGMRPLVPLRFSITRDGKKIQVSARGLKDFDDNEIDSGATDLSQELRPVIADYIKCSLISDLPEVP